MNNSCNLCCEETNELKEQSTCEHKLCLECLQVTDQCPLCYTSTYKTNLILLDYLNSKPVLKQTTIKTGGGGDTSLLSDHHLRLSRRTNNNLSENLSKVVNYNKQDDNDDDTLSESSSGLSSLVSSLTNSDQEQKSESKEQQQQQNHQTVKLIYNKHLDDIDNVCYIMVDDDNNKKMKNNSNNINNLTKIFIMSLLFVINLINLIDRFTLAGVLKQVQKYFSINDKECGLMHTVFLCSHMLLAPLFGYLGDRYSRKWICVFGCSCWSLTTFLGAFVPQNKFWLFLVLRSLVGIGEASYVCLAPTIIGDLFKGKARTNCLAIFYLAVPFGSGLGYILGSAITKAYNDEWQYALMLTPPIGLVCILLLIFFVDEPKRGAADGSVHMQSTSSLFSDMIYLSKNKTYVWITFAFTCSAFVLGGLSWWFPIYVEYAINSKNQRSEMIPLIFGVITCISGLLGVVISSLITPKLRSYRGFKDPMLCAFGSLLAVPILFVSVLITRSSNPIVFWLFTSIGITSLCLSWTIVAEILLYIVQPNKRSIASALHMLIIHLFGDAGSPFFIGHVSDYLRENQPDTFMTRFTSLQTALYSGPLFIGLAFFGYLIASIYVEEDKKKVDDYIKKNNRQSDNTIGENLLPKFQKSDSGLSSLYASNNIKLDTQLMNNNSDNTESLSISNLSNSKINNNNDNTTTTTTTTASATNTTIKEKKKSLFRRIINKLN